MAKRTCSIDWCPRPHSARGWCKRHYWAWTKYGDPLAPPKPSRWMPTTERFLAKVCISTEGCAEWAGRINPNGYGEFSVGGRNGMAHRWAYEHFVGPIPEGLQLDHLCRNRRCVLPAHLEPVTGRENKARSPFANQHKTHCKFGHPLVRREYLRAADPLWRGQQAVHHVQIPTREELQGAAAGRQGDT